MCLKPFSILTRLRRFILKNANRKIEKKGLKRMRQGNVHGKPIKKE